MIEIGVEHIQELFFRAKNSEAMIQCLEETLHFNSPMAIYQCAETIDKFEWIFNEKYIVEVLGGEDVLQYYMKAAPKDDEYLVIFLFKKIGPFKPIFISKKVLFDILDELRLRDNF